MFFYWWIWYFILQNWWLVFTNHSCSVSEGNHMHPSRTSDFGALEQNIGLCIEETTILSRGIWLWILLGMLVYNDFIIVQCCIFFFFFKILCSYWILNLMPSVLVVTMQFVSELSNALDGSCLNLCVTKF